MDNKKKVIKRVSLDFPIYLLDQIDSICEANFMARRKWFIDAANEKLERDKLTNINILARK